MEKFAIICSYFTEEKGKYWEVLYQGEFSDKHPLTGKPCAPPRPSWQEATTDGANSLPILSLTHVTHNREAEQIRQNDLVFVFKPRKKFGKTLDRHDRSKKIGETFIKVDDGYKRILPDALVFPGYLSWWGISSQDSYKSDHGRNFREALVKAKERDYLKEAGYLKIPPSSRYGNRGFIFSFQDLISGYKASRNHCKVKDVYLKKAGTLRYKREICYVIIVVMTDDLENKTIRELPSIFYEPCLDHNGCIDEDGKLINDRSPSFKLKHPIESCNWESMAFAFYFPSSNNLLRLNKELGREVEVDHTFCTSKRPRRHPPYDWVCPNDL